jgi:hypothetical protein
MSVLREAHDRALRLQELNEAVYNAHTSGQEVPKDKRAYARPVRTGMPADVVDRYTYVTQMGVPNDEGTRGRARNRPVVKRAKRVEAVVEALYDFMEDVLEED